MRSLLTLSFIINCLIGFSQKQLTLIIDTIDFVDDIDQYDFKINLTNQGLANLGEIDTSSKSTTKYYPNFQTVVSLNSDSTNIQIPIDDQNGFLEISNIYNYDTIRIDYLKLYSNCYKDTSETVIEYYRIINDTVSNEPYKVKHKTTTHKDKCKRKPPYKTTLTINQKKYMVSIQKKLDGVEELHGHGYKPKRYQKDSENFKGKATRIYINSVTSNYLNVITVIL